MVGVFYRTTFLCLTCWPFTSIKSLSCAIAPIRIVDPSSAHARSIGTICVRASASCSFVILITFCAIWLTRLKPEPLETLLEHRKTQVWQHSSPAHKCIMPSCCLVALRQTKPRVKMNPRQAIDLKTNHRQTRSVPCIQTNQLADRSPRIAAVNPLDLPKAV